MTVLPLRVSSSRRANAAVEHPARAAGCTRKQIAVFERIAVGTDEWHPPRIVAALEAKGLVTLRNQMVAGWPFPLAVLRPFLPAPVHVRWCRWYAEYGPSAGSEQASCPAPLTDAQRRLLLRMSCGGEAHGPDPSIHRGDLKTISGAEGRELVERGLIAVSPLREAYDTERFDAAPYPGVTHRYYITAAGRAALREAGHHLHARPSDGSAGYPPVGQATQDAPARAGLVSEDCPL